MTTYPPPLEANATKLSSPLVGKAIRLVPLTREDAPRLHEAFREDDLWTWQGRQPKTLAETQEWIEEALTPQYVAFLIVTEEGHLAGTTRYLDLRWHDAGVEIGWTMVFAPFRRTRVNTEAKWLLLKRAFDAGFARVQLKTDRLNERSRKAILRIGAQFEGIMRCAKRRPDGTLRDNAMFAVTFEDWPEVEAALLRRLAP